MQPGVAWCPACQLSPCLMPETSHYVRWSRGELYNLCFAGAADFLPALGSMQSIANSRISDFCKKPGFETPRWQQCFELGSEIKRQALLVVSGLGGRRLPLLSLAVRTGG